MIRTLPLIVLLTGCATLSQPVSAPTLATIEQTATLATQAADAYVLTAHPSPATLARIQSASAAVHAAVAVLEATPPGQPLDLTAINAALAALASAQ